jgi:Na+/phosphate symporter
MDAEPRRRAAEIVTTAPAGQLGAKVHVVRVGSVLVGMAADERYAEEMADKIRAVFAATLADAVAQAVKEKNDVMIEIAAEIERTKKDTEKAIAEKMKWNVEETQRFREAVDKFEKASGLKVSDGWSHPEAVGRAVKDVLNHGTEHMRQQILGHKTMLERMLQDVTKHLAENL